MNIRHELQVSIFLDTLGTPFGFSAVYLFGMELSCLNTPKSQGESNRDKVISSKSTPRIKSMLYN